MRLRVLLVVALGALLLTAASTAGKDQGSQRPPASLTDHYKALWMGEWAACRHRTLHGIASELHVKIPSGRTPQVAARMIAKLAEAPLWNLQEETTTAVDGCRNGILWRYYHE